ncbi:hypothetical protein H8E88_21610 [candidate division KSB1 bacterium]|nr:hypothetical protein [candidate division KSB1 bacterium]
MKPETISSIAAVIAALMAFASWYYNKEITKGLLSLYDVKVSGSRVEQQVSIEFLFLFKNIGHQNIKIEKIQLGHYDFKRKVFENISKPLVVNDIYPESIFNYSNSFSMNIKQDISNEQLSSKLPTLVGKHCMIMSVDYKVKSIFSIGTKSLKSYFGYVGKGAVYQLTIDDYKEMSNNLPNEFKKEDL